jgi:hypothetical protein
MSPIYLDLLIELKAKINIFLTQLGETFEHSIAAHILSEDKKRVREKSSATMRDFFLFLFHRPRFRWLARVKTFLIYYF